MPATIAHHAAGCRSKRSTATAAGKILDATRPAVELVNLVRPSTCSPCRRRSLTTRPAADRSGPGPRPRARSSTPRGRPSSWSTWSGPRRCSPCRRRSLTTRPAVDRCGARPRPRARSSTPRGPGADRRGPGDTIHHAARPSATWSGPRRGHHAGDDRSPRGRLSIEAEHGHGRGQDPRRHAARAPIDADQVTRFTTRPGRRQPGQALDVATMPATIAHHAAGLSIEADQGHGRGKILDATRAGRRAGQLGQALDVLTMPATIAHHGPGLSIEAEHGHGRGQDPRRHAARAPIDADQVTRFTTRPGRRQPGQALDVATMPATIAHHAAGCRSKRTRATAAGKILDATRPAVELVNLVRPSTCSPCRRRSLTTRPAADRRGPGPRPRARSSTPRGRPSSWSTWSGPRRCSPCRRRSLTTRPAVDRSGARPRPRARSSTRTSGPGCRAGQPGQGLDVAHHAGDD